MNSEIDCSIEIGGIEIPVMPNKFNYCFSGNKDPAKKITEFKFDILKNIEIKKDKIAHIKVLDFEFKIDVSSCKDDAGILDIVVQHINDSSFHHTAYNDDNWLAFKT